MQHTKLAIIGAGPAGYSAAIYAARATLAPVQFTGVKTGGQLMYTTEVENYAGFKDGINGPELMFSMAEQAKRFGTDLRAGYISAVDFSAKPFKLWTNLPDDFDATKFEGLSAQAYQELRAKIMTSEPALTADAVIISTGATSKHVGAKGEDEFLGRGVSTCAVCDAAFFRDKVTYVVGGGDSAMEDAMALAKFASSVTILHRRDSFKASKIMQDRVLNHPKIKVMWNTSLDEILGEGMVQKIKVTTNGEAKELEAQGVFIAIGHNPVTQIFAGQVELDAHGYVVTRSSFSTNGLKLAQAALKENLVHFPSMTSVDGVFAGGDVVDVRYKQAITAAGQGAMAALDAERWLEEQAN